MIMLEALKRFNDSVAGVKRQIGDVFEVDDERGRGLLNHPENIVREHPGLDFGQPAPVNQDLTPPLKSEQSFEPQSGEGEVPVSPEMSGTGEVAPEQPSEPEVAQVPENATTPENVESGEVEQSAPQVEEVEQETVPENVDQQTETPSQNIDVNPNLQENNSEETGRVENDTPEKTENSEVSEQTPGETQGEVETEKTEELETPTQPAKKPVQRAKPKRRYKGAKK